MINRMTVLYTIFVIVSNTVIQYLIAEKNTKGFILIWLRDTISIYVFISLHQYWQLYIVAWQFVMSSTGYICWKRHEKTGVMINQFQLLKLLIVSCKMTFITIAKLVKQKLCKT